MHPSLPALPRSLTAPRFLLTALSVAVLGAYAPVGNAADYVYPHTAFEAAKVKELDEGTYDYKKADTTGKAATLDPQTLKELKATKNTQFTLKSEAEKSWNDTVFVVQNKDAKLTVEGNKTKLTVKAVVLDADVGADTASIQLLAQDKGELLAESLWLHQGRGQVTGEETKVTISGASVLGGKAGSVGFLTIDTKSLLKTKDLILGDGGAAESVGGHGVLLVKGQGRLDITGKLYGKAYGGGSVNVETGGVVTSKDVELGSSVSKELPISSVLISGEGSKWTSETFKVQHNSFVTLAEDGALDIKGSGEAGGSGKGVLQLAGKDSLMYIGSGVLPPGSSDVVAPAKAGKLMAAQIIMANDDEEVAKTQKVIFNHSTADYTFRPKIKSAHGTLQHLAGTTTLASDLTEFKGALLVEGGKLTVNQPLSVSRINVQGKDTQFLAKEAVTLPHLEVSKGGQVTLNKDLMFGANAQLGVRGAMSKLAVLGKLKASGESVTIQVLEGGALDTKALEFGDAEALEGKSFQATVANAGSKWTAQMLKLGTQAKVTLKDYGELNIRDDAGLVFEGKQATLIIGDGEGAAVPGVLEAKKLAFSSDAEVGKTQTLVFSHNTNAESYDFQVPLSGKGMVTHLAGTTRLQGDSSGFSGTTTVSGGRLLVNLALGGTLIIKATGQAGGVRPTTATIGNTQVQEGGTLLLQDRAQLEVNGDLTLASKSTLSATLSSNVSSVEEALLTVTGKAVLEDGSLLSFTLPGEKDITLGKAYPLLTAAGKV